METRKEFLPLFKPVIDDEEIKEVTAILKSGWLTTGPKTREFEEKFAEYSDAKHGIGVINCTTALFMCLEAANMEKGSEVITTPLTWCSSATVIENAGMKTVFADVNKRTGCIDPKEIEKKITKKTRAIIPVHFAGQPCDMDPILELAEKHSLTVVEDAAHAIGASYKNRKIGGISRFTCFSFYANKNLTTGQGGMITVNDDEDNKILRMMRMYGLKEGAEDRYSEKTISHYLVEFPGYNFRLFDLLAAVGLPQLKKFDALNAKRKKIMDTYNKAFSGMEHVEVYDIEDYTTSHGLHLYSILADIDNLSITRDQFINELRSMNVGTGLHYDALHYHPFFKKKYGLKKGDFPNAEYLSDRTISLPFFPSMTEDDTLYVINAVEDIIKKFKK